MVINAKKDFFISYTVKDVSWATWIARTLEDAGYSTIIQAWDFNVGDNFVEKMDASLKNSERFLAVLSEKYLSSPYCKAEWVAAYANDIKLEKGLFIPVRIEYVIPSGVFTDVACIDLFGINEEASMKKLLDGVILSGARNIPGKAGTIKQRFPGDMPLNNLPYSRNPYFTGRDEKLEVTHKNFKSGENISLTQSITGLGGVGKTAIALEYAYRYSHEYETIWWVNGETSTNALIAYRDFALQKRIITEDAKADEIIDAMKRWFKKNENWLFIYDNADSDDFNKWLETYLPQSNKGHVLVTTRSSNFPRSKLVDIIVFNESDAVIFLKDRTQKIGEGYADELAKTLANRLQYLPLALEQAAAYIVETPNVKYNDYIDLLTDRGVATFEQDNYLVDYTSIINLTWNISMQKITNEGARQMFKMCAYFAPDRIPVDMFVKGSEVLPEPLKVDFVDLLKRNEILRDLTRYSLLTLGRNNDISADEKRVLNMHRLLQEVVHKSFDKNNAWLGYGLDLMRKVVEWEKGDKKSIDAFKMESPHTIVIAEKATILFSDEEKLRKVAWLFDANGYEYHGLGDRTKAFEYFNKALSIRETINDKDHPDKALSYNNIGQTYRAAGNYTKALDYYNKALTIYEKFYGEEHPDMAAPYNNIGAVYTSRSKFGDHVKVLEYFNKALLIHKKFFGEEHPDTATSYNNLGGYYSSLHIYKNKIALEYYKKALAIFEKVCGVEHPNTAAAYNNIGSIYFKLGKHTKALEYINKALIIYEKIFEENDHRIATSYLTMSVVLCKLGNHEKALEYCKKTLMMCIDYEKDFGEEHPISEPIYSNSYAIYKKIGDRTQASKYQKKVQIMFERRLWSRSPLLYIFYFLYKNSIIIIIIGIIAVSFGVLPVKMGIGLILVPVLISVLLIGFIMNRISNRKRK